MALRRFLSVAPELRAHYEHALMRDSFLSSTLSYQSSVHETLMQRLSFEHFQGGSIRMVDLGCGTGVTSARILASLKQRNETRPISVLCVDPHSVALINREALCRAFPGAVVETLSMSSGSFARLNGTFSHVLLKEVVHHCVDHQDEFRGIYSQLEPGGKMVIVTRPVEVDYPFFPRLKEIWRSSQAPISLFEEAVRVAGFAHQETSEHVFQFTVTKPAIIDWIQSRCWSEFSKLTPTEMAAGLDQLKHTYSNYITFNDRLLFLTATK